jgi:xanthine dehydrogenase accessory factor
VNIWKKANELLQQNQHLVLLKVVWHQGSSPGKQGFEMLVCEDGTLLGSIGGGRTEFQLVERAKQMLATQNPDFIFKKEVHREDDENTSGMICAGEQWVVLISLQPIHMAEVSKLADTTQGSLTITPQKWFYQEATLETTYHFNYLTDRDWTYTENLNKKSHLYIIGGGHVGVATAKIFQDLDFEVYLYDNRPGLNTFEQETFADVKKIIDFQNIKEHILQGKQTYIVILTHNFQSDAEVLELLQEVETRYIGVLGSKSKIKTMLKGMLAKGVNPTFIASIDAPIGMPINSITPAEIGVSIAARVIGVRNG